MHQIYLKLKDGVKDSHGAKVATMISDYLNLQVGNVKCGKIFMIDHKLSEEHLLPKSISIPLFLTILFLFFTYRKYNNRVVPSPRLAYKYHALYLRGSRGLR